ncbi:MBL fold metallo-hydrolase [Aerococcus urinaeequi]|uniref:MBL fold metallo-hydrolase n=1 Tax=Aerococcus urinaeequi TaxID=51665 RepID=UPI0036703947
MLEIKTFGSNSTGNCYLLKDGSSHLLLEAGINPKRMSIDWSKVEGVLISHEHQDHAKYAKEIIKRTGADLYCSEGTSSVLRGVPSHRIHMVSSKRSFNIGGWKIMPFDIEHDAQEPLGFLIETPSKQRVLFATDTYYIRYKFTGITHLMIECNYSLEILESNYKHRKIDKKQRNRIITSHFELNNVRQFLQSNDLSKLEEVHLLHLSDRNSDAEQFKREIQAIVGVPTYIAE